MTNLTDYAESTVSTVNSSLERLGYDGSKLSTLDAMSIVAESLAMALEVAASGLAPGSAEERDALANSLLVASLDYVARAAGVPRLDAE